jgi:ribosomal protein S18 acetylase RimI-like enzyme
VLLIRPALPGDEAAVAGVHVRSWQVGYRGMMPDAYLETLRPEERAQRYSFGEADPHKPATLLALADDVICGFATIMPSPDVGSLGKGELAALYVDPECWGRGLGAMLLAEARARLATRGFGSAVLWVLAGNTRAQRFYERDGWQATGVMRNQEIWGITLQEAGYSRRLP